MKIRRLEIQGFKSFADRTVLKFGEGITGVVGPNGCGKSNIVDAIRWVMGEQSAKHLRGAGMQDVIFAGSEKRGPSGLAEVTLSFKNDGNLVPEEYRQVQEISVTRRLFRDGTSEYAINRTPCRLRDILDLFMGTGIGKNAYSIIEQGRIGLIVTSKPEDRRAVIEDAAGVSRYKARRKQAERRIEATEQNLLRVKDITDELEKRLDSLERQAKKAERYKRIKQELRALDLHAAAHRYLDLTSRERHEDDQINGLRASIQAIEEAIGDDEVALTAALDAIAQQDEALRHREQQLHEKQQALALSRNNVDFLTREIEKLNERRQEAAQERQQILEQLDEVRRQHAEAHDLNERLQSTGGDETETLAARQDALSALSIRIEAAEAEVEQQKQAVVETLTAMAQHRSNHVNLERASHDLNARIERGLQGKKIIAKRRREAKGRVRDIARELWAKRSARDELEAQRHEHESHLEALTTEQAETEARLTSARSDLMTKRSRLGSLKDIQRNYEGCNDAVRSIMKHRTERPGLDRTLHGLVADFVSAEPRFEAAVEAVLGERLQYVVVSSQDDGVSSIEYLKSSTQGRSSFIPLDLREDHVSWAPRPASKRPGRSALASNSNRDLDRPSIDGAYIHEASRHPPRASMSLDAGGTYGGTPPSAGLSAEAPPDTQRAADRETPTEVESREAQALSSHAGPAYFIPGGPEGTPSPELVDALMAESRGLAHESPPRLYSAGLGEADADATAFPAENFGGDDMVPSMMGSSLPIPDTADSVIWSFDDEEDLWPDMGAPGVVGKMVDLIRSTPGYEHVARVLLGDVVVVDGLEHARKLWRENGHRKTLVTLSGEVLDPVGVIAGGSSDGISSGMLAQKREIKELSASVAELEDVVATTAAHHGALKARRAELEDALKRIGAEIHQADLALVGLDQAEKKLIAEIQREDRDIAAATDELQAMREKRGSLVEERDQAQRHVTELEARRTALDAQVEEEARAVEALRTQARALEHEVTELKVTVAASTERRENAARNLAQMTSRLADLERREQRALEIEEHSVEECERLAENVERARAEGEALERVVDGERSEVEAERARVETEQQALRQRDAEVRAQRRQADEQKTHLNDAIVRRRELQIAMENLTLRTTERYRLNVRDIVCDYHLLPEQPAGALDQAEKLRGQIDRMGPINLTAIDEYDEVSKRYAFLADQKKDLEEAIASLRTAIRKINKTSRERYLEAFRLVNDKFQQVFPRLFNGGSASLIMMDESDPLESGIEMLAQPPGKKLQSVTLLSGGEKALTAVALIFAIFLIKPTPFCLLDEVDAPLDEANVGRYNEMIQDMSSIAQFILITHNKRTMELPDRLYGVTMEDPGVSKIVPVDVVSQDRPLRAVS
ncbi:MAG: chromosome segregation protein SMC [Deltaproteobacteria bacterium]|nr:chromosome segregation protein SMC [Deltaproteobacteria bacterium]